MFAEYIHSLLYWSLKKLIKIYWFISIKKIVQWTFLINLYVTSRIKMQLVCGVCHLGEKGKCSWLHTFDFLSFLFFHPCLNYHCQIYSGTWQNEVFFIKRPSKTRKYTTAPGKRIQAFLSVITLEDNNEGEEKAFRERMSVS